MSEAIKCVIDREKWCRVIPETSVSFGGSKLLLNDDGFRCCLGFACQSLGVDDDEMLGIGQPSDFENALAVRLIKIEDEAIEANDAPASLELFAADAQESKIVDLFHSVGIDVEFIN